MPTSKPEHEPHLTAGDWIAVVLTGLCVLFCLQFPFVAGPAFRKMWSDFGSELPPLTELGMTTWFPMMLGLNPASVAFYAVATPRLGIQRRRFFLVLSFIMGLVAVGLLLVAMYQPIFQLAGNIQ